MSNKQQLLSQFKIWLPFLQQLLEVEEIWSQPIAANKWTVKEVVSHIMLWDQFFYEEAIRKLADHDPLSFQHVDFDSFNEHAKLYGHANTISRIVSESVVYRTAIVDCIDSMSIQQCEQDYPMRDGNQFNVLQYLHDFIRHDQHHMSQIEALMAQLRVHEQV
ncbi:DinB family protein [Paenibacillus taiwanensis]|uniref:DinB family protein n=1 Tax=Paenibacillus taiwanensis TaxID=401638 RepID=UPI00040E39D9|nr:DinB family protein [Paenibacillus taiwanensis]